MYTVTFYSFKGGVGRTMALMNVAIELVKQGRRVLVVDFDLEAPGLDTFGLSQTPVPAGGVVDFVTRYLEAGTAPDVTEYLSSSWEPRDGPGKLWIMPSGAHTKGYAASLANIDWGALYGRHDGYLLFEDIKAQWKATIDPDYVLIDSRTGHTDTGGICTRQLPDSVVVLFFPNVQNLRGLEKVVRDIKTEAQSPRNKLIQLHYVMSNVPDIDDEDSILENIRHSFKERLELDDDPMVIHRYDSLSLLNQVVFTKDRPRSRLSTEYRALTATLAKHNPADRAGALDYVRSVAMDAGPVGYGHWTHSTATAEHLKRIEQNHATDGEVLFRLAACYGDEDADILYTKAIEADYRVPIVYLARALSRFRHGDRDRAESDALQVIRATDASNRELRRAISLVTSQRLMKVAGSTDLTKGMSPEVRIWIASERLVHSREELQVARILLQDAVADEQLTGEQQERATNNLVLTCIALGAADEAMEIIREQQPIVDEMDIQQAFNYGMAAWAAIGEVVVESFARVVTLHAERPETMPDANYLQCMAVAHWAAGQTETAVGFAELAKQQNHISRRREFSCWRYMKVSAREFGKDTDEIIGMIEGAALLPGFMRSQSAES